MILLLYTSATAAMNICQQMQTVLTTKEGESYGAAGAVVEEVLSCIRTVMAYGGEAKEVDRSVIVKDFKCGLE